MRDGVPPQEKETYIAEKLGPEDDEKKNIAGKRFTTFLAVPYRPTLTPRQQLAMNVFGGLC